LEYVLEKKSVVVIAGKGELGSEYTDEDIHHELLGVGNGEIVEATSKGCHQRESKKEGGVLVMNVGHQHATTNLVGHLVPFSSPSPSPPSPTPFSLSLTTPTPVARLSTPMPSSPPYPACPTSGIQTLLLSRWHYSPQRQQKTIQN